MLMAQGKGFEPNLLAKTFLKPLQIFYPPNNMGSNLCLVTRNMLVWFRKQVQSKRTRTRLGLNTGNRIFKKQAFFQNLAEF
jgi:hypothetical protein